MQRKEKNMIKNKENENMALDKELLLALKSSKDLLPEEKLQEHLKSFKHVINYVDSIWYDRYHTKSVNYLNEMVYPCDDFLDYLKEKKHKLSALAFDSVSCSSGYVEFEDIEESQIQIFELRGVFEVSTKDFKFIISSLWFDNNKLADDLTNMVSINPEDHDKYIKLRNDYNKWSVERQRNKPSVYVVNGEDIPFSRGEMSWDDVVLPAALKADIKNSVEGFLSAKKMYEQAKMPWKRGLLFFGPPGGGKTSTIKAIISNYDFKPVTIQAGAACNDQSLLEAFSYARLQKPALLYFEDLDSMLQNVSLSNLLNLMDGVSTKDGLLIIATSNNPERLEESIINRPSRFDRKFLFPYPDLDLAVKYLKKCFGKYLADKDIKKVAQVCIKNQFSFSHIKEVYLSSMFAVLAENRQKPILNDILIVIDNINNDKKSITYVDNQDDIGII